MHKSLAYYLFFVPRLRLRRSRIPWTLRAADRLEDEALIDDDEAVRPESGVKDLKAPVTFSNPPTRAVAAGRIRLTGRLRVASRARQWFQAASCDGAGFSVVSGACSMGSTSTTVVTPLAPYQNTCLTSAKRPMLRWSDRPLEMGMQIPRHLRSHHHTAHALLLHTDAGATPEAPLASSLVRSRIRPPEAKNRQRKPRSSPALLLTSTLIERACPPGALGFSSFGVLAEDLATRASTSNAPASTGEMVEHARALLGSARGQVFSLLCRGATGGFYGPAAVPRGAGRYTSRPRHRGGSDPERVRAARDRAMEAAAERRQNTPGWK